MIVIALVRARKLRVAMTGNTNCSSEDETRMLAAVVVVFVVLELPVFAEINTFERTRLQLLMIVPSLMNSSCNFLLYAAFGRTFRNDVKSLFNSEKKKSDSGSDRRAT
jgi:hypothetical protein